MGKERCMTADLFKKICEEEGLIHHGDFMDMVEYSVKNPVFTGYLIDAAQYSCAFDDDGEPTEEPLVDISISDAFFPFCKGFNRHVHLKGHYLTEENLRDHLKRVKEAYKQIKKNIKVQTTMSVDQFCDLLRSCEVSAFIDTRKVMKATKITLDKPVEKFLKGFMGK